MGTRFELLLSGTDARALNGLLDQLVEEIEEWDRRLSLFRSDSLVAHINRQAASRPVRLDGQTFGLLATCLQVYRDSQGAFDVTVAPLMRSFGFHSAVAQQTLEDATDCGSDGLRLDASAQTVAFTRPGLGIDLGAVGKGFVLDLLVEQLCEERSLVDAALLHGGTSTVIGLGCPERRHGFDVLIPASEMPAVTVGATRICLRDQALSVSFREGRTVRHGGSRMGHVIDPIARRPAEGGPDRAAVVGCSALLTDAWSTALLAAGPRPLRLPPALTNVALSAHPPAHPPAQWTT